MSHPSARVVPSVRAPRPLLKRAIVPRGSVDRRWQPRPPWRTGLAWRPDPRIARLLAELTVARLAVQGADGRVTAAIAVPTRVPAGLLLGGSIPTGDGAWARIAARLLASHATCAASQPVPRVWMEWIGTYAQAVDPAQMSYDAQALMTAVGIEPLAHPWILCNDLRHWHLLVGRVRRDGLTVGVPHLREAMRRTIAVLDAEGEPRAHGEPAGRRATRRASDHGSTRPSPLQAIWTGRTAAGAATARAIPLQGPVWAARLASLGRYPHRTPGLTVRSAPAVPALAALVRRCLLGDRSPASIP